MSDIKMYVNEPEVSYVHTRLLELFALKSHRYEMYRTVMAEYKQYKQKPNEGDYARYRMNTGFAIVNTKLAEILTSTPEYDFVPMDDVAKKFKKVRKNLWNYVWEVSKTDYAIYRIVTDALKYGTGWGMEYIAQEVRKVKEPTKQSDGTITFEEKDIVDYDGCKLEHIAWENVFVNGYDINKTTEAAVVRHYDRDEFFQIFGNNPMFQRCTEDEIPKGKYYYVPTSAGEYNILIPNGTSLSDSQNIQSYRKVSVLTYWNKYTDSYIILANGVWINKYEGEVMGIPSPNKEIPLVAFTDHYLEDDIWGMGEYDISKDSRDLKDESRSLILEVIKAQAGLITIDPTADWDEATLQLGIRKFAKVNKEDIGFFAPNINASSLQYLENKLDEDIIIETGVDFRSQLLGPGETATKTAGRIEASKKRINLGMKLNAYTFFERFARLRMSNMEFYYSDKPRKIFVKGEDYTGTIKEALSGGYGVFTVEPKYMKGKFTILPIMSSLMGESSDKNKQKWIEAVQLFMNMKNKDGTPTVDSKNIIESGRGIMDDVLDLDKLLAVETVQKSPEQILKEAGLFSKKEGAPMEGATGGIPPAQMSGAPVTLASTPNQ